MQGNTGLIQKHKGIYIYIYRIQRGTGMTQKNKVTYRIQ